MPVTRLSLNIKRRISLYARQLSDRSDMTLKIEKYADGDSTTIRLIGRMQTEHLED